MSMQGITRSGHRSLIESPHGVLDDQVVATPPPPGSVDVNFGFGASYLTDPHLCVSNTGFNSCNYWDNDQGWYPSDRAGSNRGFNELDKRLDASPVLHFATVIGTGDSHGSWSESGWSGSDLWPPAYTDVHASTYMWDHYEQIGDDYRLWYSIPGNGPEQRNTRRIDASNSTNFFPSVDFIISAVNELYNRAVTRTGRSPRSYYTSIGTPGRGAMWQGDPNNIPGWIQAQIDAQTVGLRAMHDQLRALGFTQALHSFSGSESITNIPVGGITGGFLASIPPAPL